MDREQRESRHWYDKLFTFNLTNFPHTLCLKNALLKEVSVFSICKFLQSLYKRVRCEKHYTANKLHRAQETVHSLQNIVMIMLQLMWNYSHLLGFLRIVQMSILCHLHEQLKPHAHCIHLIISSTSDAEFHPLSAVVPSSPLPQWNALALLTILSRISCYSLKGLQDYCPDICKYQWNFSSADHGF